MLDPMNVAVAERSTRLDIDQRVFMRADWALYEALDAARGESAVPRLTFLDGVLELMNVSRSHERYKTAIARLVEAYAVELRLRVNGYGSWTLKSKDQQRGAEADECYIVGANPESKDKPDLAIEVVWTSGGIDKLEVYRGLGVREIWVWQDHRITVHELRDGTYFAVPGSAVLPQLDLDLIARLAEIPDQLEAVLALRAELSRRRGD